jgi:hypothetical protein
MIAPKVVQLGARSTVRCGKDAWSASAPLPMHTSMLSCTTRSTPSGLVLTCLSHRLRHRRFWFGKYGGGIQVIVHQTDGQQRIFLADVPYAIAGWFAFLKQQGASVPATSFIVCGLPVKLRCDRIPLRSAPQDQRWSPLPPAKPGRCAFVAEKKS